jgi:hypothetical protein
MRIDAHQHFWVYDQREYAWIDDSMASLRRDFLSNDLKPGLERNGFQGSVVVQARQTLEETRWLLELATNTSLLLAWSDGLICGPPTSVRNWKPRMHDSGLIYARHQSGGEFTSASTRPRCKRLHWEETRSSFGS